MLTKLTAGNFNLFAGVKLGERVVFVDPVGTREARPDRRSARGGRRLQELEGAEVRN